MPRGIWAKPFQYQSGEGSYMVPIFITAILEYTFSETYYIQGNTFQSFDSTYHCIYDKDSIPIDAPPTYFGIASKDVKYYGAGHQIYSKPLFTDPTTYLLPSGHGYTFYKGGSFTARTVASYSEIDLFGSVEESLNGFSNTMMRINYK
jgi:hypothetical protein